MNTTRIKISSITITFLMILTMFTSVFILYPIETVKADPFSWNMYNVDTGDIMQHGAGYKLATMSNGDVGVAYFRNMTGGDSALNFIYATSSDNGQTWSYEDIYTEGDYLSREVSLCYNETDNPYLIFSSSTTDSSPYDDTGLIFWNSSSSSWTFEDINLPWRISERTTWFNDSNQQRPCMIANSYEQTNYDTYYYYWSGSSWSMIEIVGGSSTYNGRSVKHARGTDDIIWTSMLSNNRWELHNSTDYGETWNYLGIMSDDTADSHIYGDIVVNNSNIPMSCFIQEDAGDDVQFDYYDGSFHTDVTVGTPSEYNYQDNALIEVNSTDSIFVAWYSRTSDNVIYSWSDDGLSFDSETIWTGNATNNNNAEVADFKINKNDGWHYILMEGGDYSNGVGGDADLVIAVRQEPQPASVESVYTATGLIDDTNISFSFFYGNPAWSNATDPPGATLQVVTKVNDTDNCTDIFIDAINLSFGGYYIDMDDVVAVVSIDDNASYDSTGYDLVGGANFSFNDNWASLSDDANPFPIDGTGWTNMTFNVRFYMDTAQTYIGTYVNIASSKVLWNVTAS